MDKYLKQFVTKLFHTESRLLSPAIYASEFYINRGTYRVNKKDRASLISNRPFYRYGGHIELLGFKEYYGMPGGRRGGEGMSTIRCTRTSIYARFSGQFFFKFS